MHCVAFDSRVFLNTTNAAVSPTVPATAWDVAKNLTGTLDGDENPGDVQLSKGENRSLECALVPANVASQLDGYWKATVNGEAAEIVSINMTGGRAVIVPPRGLSAYDNLGQVQVSCEFFSKQNESLFKFDRNVTVVGECWNMSEIAICTTLLLFSFECDI